MAVRVQDIDIYGRGVARDEGRIVFIEGALPDELVDYQPLKRQKRFLEAKVGRIYEESPARIAPLCPYYEQCGGCALQHFAFEAQVQAKERFFTQQLQRIGQTSVQELLPPIAGKPWRYRTRTRLAVQYHDNAVRLGYFARASHEVVDVADCLIIDEQLAAVLPGVRDLLTALLPKRIKSLSLHRGEAACALQLESDAVLPLDVLEDWQRRQQGNWALWLNAECMAGDAQGLFYDLPAEAVRIAFAPQDFTQVNPVVNRALVAQAMAWVAESQAESVVDFFAGLGNFSVPMAKRGLQVQAVEGVREMVERMQAVAAQNAVQERLAARREDLFKPSKKALKQWQQQDLWFLDPPRAGAAELLRAMDKDKMRRMIYVSCDSATLARDAQILAQKGFVAKVGLVANMFAQTAHVESMVRFEREH